MYSNFEVFGRQIYLNFAYIWGNKCYNSNKTNLFFNFELDNTKNGLLKLKYNLYGYKVQTTMDIKSGFCLSKGDRSDGRALNSTTLGAS